MEKTDAFDTYQNLTGAVLDSTTGLLRLTPDQFANLQSLFFHIGEVNRQEIPGRHSPLIPHASQNTFEFTPNAQIWPRAASPALHVYTILELILTPNS